MASQCWRSAKSCHSTETSSSGSKSTCQAWFRCEAAGDYVIRWHCHPTGENGGPLNATSFPFTQCDDAQRAREAIDCPPPVVCANDPYDEDVHITNDLSSDLILAIVLASFAVIAVMLIMASTYKYCKIRKRRHRRPMQPRQLYIRDFPYPVRYHNRWGANTHFYDVFNKKTTSSPPVYSGPFQDVYFSRPYETSRKFEHLLSSSDDSIEDFPVSRSRHDHAPRPGAKHKTDPSVVTGSFVFHQPGSAGAVSGGHGVKEWSDGRSYSTKKDGKDNGSDDNSECYHIYRGNLSRFHHLDNANFSQQPKHHGKKDQQQHLPDMSAEFLPFPRMSSISIPSYVQPPGKSKRSDKFVRDQQLREEKTERFPGNIFDASSSRASCGSISPYATGCLDHSPKVHGRDPKKSRRGSPHSNSPDVISSHNFTNAFVRVGLNVYRSLRTRASSDGSVSSRDFHEGDHSRKKVSGKHAKTHHGGNHNGNNAELSYDSFRNEHLRDLATKGTASSSTLEAGFRHKTHDIETPTHSRY